MCALEVREVDPGCLGVKGNLVGVKGERRTWGCRVLRRDAARVPSLGCLGQDTHCSDQMERSQGPRRMQ